MTTPSGELLNANPALARIMGYDTPEQLISGASSDIAQPAFTGALNVPSTALLIGDNVIAVDVLLGQLWRIVHHDER